MKVLLRTPMSQYSGYGRDGLGLAAALLDRGHDVRLSPSMVDAPLPREIAALLTLPVDGPFDLALYHIEAEHADLELSDAMMARTNVLWSMWGWPALPDEPWVPGFAPQVEAFDHVFAYDPDSYAAFAPHVAPDRLHTLLGGYASADWQPKEDDKAVEKHPFTFAMNGRLTTRKGVFTTYRAFNKMCDDHEGVDAQLVLRTTQPIFPPSFVPPERVRIDVSRSLPDDLRHFYRSIDTLVCPSWAEAKHLPPIEALTCGTPVILSDITGHRLWATREMATIVPTQTKTLMQGFTGGYVDPEDLAAAMWLHYCDARSQRLKADLAARTLPPMLDWSRCVERLGLAIGLPL